MRNAVIVVCVVILVIAGAIFFPRSKNDEIDDTETEIPQTTKVQPKGNRIECELKNYTNDGKIGVTVHYVSVDANSTIVNVFFKNISDRNQPLNLKDVFVEDRGNNILYLKRYEIVWQTSDILSEYLDSLDPEEGVRVDYYFEKTEKLLRYFVFRNIYYENYEYTIWKVKIVY